MSFTCRQRREAAGLSIRELADRSGINRGSISRIERGWPATDVEAAALLYALERRELALDREADEKTGVIGSPNEDDAA